MELGVRALAYGEREAPAEGFAPSLGVSASVLFPTGSQTALTGDGSFGVRGQVVLSLLSALLTPVAGLGISYRPERAYLGTTTGPELSWLLGLHLRQSIVRIEAELRGGTTLTNGQAFSGDSVPMELLVGGHLFVDTFTVGLAVDAGVTQALGTPDVRVIGTFGFGAPLGGGGAEGDGDGNGGGGGGGEGDDDGDGVPNATDECPADAEDADGHADADGCPETDADGDGVNDEDDFCPAQAETENGYNDDDGCPDGVEVDGDVIRPAEPVAFGRRSAAIGDDAEAVLRMVADMLRAHDEITLVQIEGHASHDEGNEARALSLSEQRAEAVLEWLSSHGVDASRLTFAGMGADVPVEGAEDQAANRRVTFRVLERR
jgi:outer membrane protein OmpA-like peptidoglycan-associated protein